jgi:hypothetical protein
LRVRDSRELDADVRGLAGRRVARHGEDAAADARPTTCPHTFDRVTGAWLPR